MAARILIMASAACVFNLVNGIPEPFPGFHPCKSSDSDCLLDNAIKGVKFFADGISSLGVKPLDPTTIKKVDASTPNLKLILSDIVITGLKTCKPLKAVRDTAKSTMFLAIQCDLNLDGNYEMDGNIFVYKLKGGGKVHARVPNIVNTATLNYILKEGKDGKKYVHVKNFKHSYELKDKSDISFEGLFQDNDVLSQAAEELFKNNGNAVIQEIGSEVFISAMKVIIEDINIFLGKLSYEDISLD